MCSEPCQSVRGQPWVCRGALQVQMQPLQYSAGVVEPAVVGTAAGGLGRWFVGVAVLPVLGEFQRRRQHSATIAHRALLVWKWPVVGMLWALQGQMQPLQYSAGVVEPAVGTAAGGLGRWFVGVAVLPDSLVFK